MYNAIRLMTGQWIMLISAETYDVNVQKKPVLFRHGMIHYCNVQKG